MYTNMLSQLQEAKLEHLMDKVLADRAARAPRRRRAAPRHADQPDRRRAGVNCVVDQAKGKPFYTSKSIQFVNLVKGTYGKTPCPVDPAFRLKIGGTREETPYDTSKYKKQENPLLAGTRRRAPGRGEKEELLLELFPNVANTFLKRLREKEYTATVTTRSKREETSEADQMWESLSEYA